MTSAQEKMVGIVIICAFVFGALGLVLWRDIFASPFDRGAGPWSEHQALRACRHLILSAASYGDPESPPSTPNLASGTEFRFDWPAGSFHFRNGFNAKVPVGASCGGNLSARWVRYLEIDGKAMLPSEGVQAAR